MSVTLKLTFPAGRYHATQWGRHVNEGVPEWPPSPWRLLRALVAVWKRTCPELSEGQVKGILQGLVGEPSFRLPRHRVAHTRHYMPWEKKGPADRTLVFDTFVSVGRCDPLFIHWPEADLSDDDLAVLARLLNNLTSFGRAEGWVQAEIAGRVPTDWNCVPCEPGADAGESVRVFCPDPETAFGDEHYPRHDPKKVKKGLRPSELLFDCPRWHLCLDTQTIHAERWPRVPGAKWVDYVIRVGAELARPTPRSHRPEPTVARFLLDAPVLPLVTDTVAVAEAFRAAAMSRFERWCRRHPAGASSFLRPGTVDRYSSPVLSGKSIDGSMSLSHGHAHYLPTAEGDDPRRVTHVTVWAPDGFGTGETAALSGLRELRHGDGWRVQLVGLGRPEDFTAGPFRASARWVSATPFVAHRHLKRRGKGRDSLEPGEGHDPRTAFLRLALRELIGKRGLADPPSVEPYEPPPGRPRPWDFRRSRNRPGDDGWRRPFGFFRLEFGTDIPGPLCLGYGSHYGLGLFLPE